MIRNRYTRSAGLRCLVCNMRAVSLRPIGALWCVLSMLVGTTCMFAFLQPVWVTVEVSSANKVWSFGLLHYCHRNLEQSRYRCRHFGSLGTLLQNLPSSGWRISCLSFGVGSSFLFVAGFMSLFTLCMSHSTHQSITHNIGRLQAFSVFLMAVGLISLPTGLGSPFLKCGQNSGWLRLGDCEIGWSYALAIMSSLLALFCPILSRYTNFGINSDQRNEIRTEKDGLLRYFRLGSREFYV